MFLLPEAEAEITLTTGKESWLGFGGVGLGGGGGGSQPSHWYMLPIFNLFTCVELGVNLL
jgi:hypothetical protein